MYAVATRRCRAIVTFLFRLVGAGTIQTFVPLRVRTTVNGAQRFFIARTTVQRVGAGTASLQPFNA